MQAVKFLEEMYGVDTFAVATLEEAITLRRALNVGFATIMVKVVVRGDRGWDESKEGGMIQR